MVEFNEITKNLPKYLLTLSIIMVATYFANNVKNSFQSNDEYELIKKYLLNDSPLYGFNKPKIWIHTKYEVNSRKWKSFYSRNSTDLNQPYIHLTIKTIINHCGNDFNICLIDDETFSKLIPSWDIDLTTIAEPMKSHIREIGMLELVYYYGGMIVPNSFICLKNMNDMYLDGISNDSAFICEKVCNSVNISKRKNKLPFAPDTYFMGAPKNNATIKELIQYLKQRNQSPHFNMEIEFLGDTSEWCIDAVNKHKMNLIGGELIGIKSTNRKPILVDELMEEKFLDLNKNTYGIYIPEDDILKRHKFQWFAVMDGGQLLETNTIIAKYLKASLVDSVSEYTTSTEMKSVVSI